MNQQFFITFFKHSSIVVGVGFALIFLFLAVFRLVNYFL